MQLKEKRNLFEIRKMEKNKTNCDKCGHDCHCGGYCFEGKDKEGVCCTRCQHEEKITDPTDLFNGA
jgi:hypothetical protein